MSKSAAFKAEYLTQEHLDLVGEKFRRDWESRAARFSPAFMDRLADGRNTIVSGAFQMRDGTTSYMRARNLGRPLRGTGNDFHDGNWALEEINIDADGTEHRQSFKKLQGPMSLIKIEDSMKFFESFQSWHQFAALESPERFFELKDDEGRARRLDRHYSNAMRSVYDALEAHGYTPDNKGRPLTPVQKRLPL
jgi:hypothetical protein